MNGHEKSLDFRSGSRLLVSGLPSRRLCGASLRHDEPIELHFAYRYGNIFTRFEFDDRFLLFWIGAVRQIDQNQERAREWYRDAAIDCRYFRFTEQIFERTDDLFSGKIGGLPDFRTAVGAECELAIGFKYGLTVFFTQLHHFQRRRTDINAENAFFLFLKETIQERHARMIPQCAFLIFSFLRVWTKVFCATFRLMIFSPSSFRRSCPRRDRRPWCSCPSPTHAYAQPSMRRNIMGANTHSLFLPPHSLNICATMMKDLVGLSSYRYRLGKSAGRSADLIR